MKIVISLVVISEIVSVYLIYKLFKSELSGIEKLLGAIVTLIPIVGPIFVLFMFDRPPPLEPSERNDGPRGEYTHSWILERAEKKEFEKSKYVRKQSDNSKGGNA